jgi:hypothetical protein
MASRLLLDSAPGRSSLGTTASHLWGGVLQFVPCGKGGWGGVASPGVWPTQVTLWGSVHLLLPRFLWADLQCWVWF